MLNKSGYYSAIKNNKIMAFVTTTWMDLEIIMLSKVSQIEKDKYHVEYRKMLLMNLLKKQK